MMDQIWPWVRARLKERTTHAGLVIVCAVVVALFAPSALLAEYAARLAQIGAVLAALHLIVTEQPPEA